MNEFAKTSVYIIVAVLFIAGTVISKKIYKPAAADYASMVGKDFYPEFTDPNAATSLTVMQFDPLTNQTRQFEVVNNKGDWRIPTHHNYPVDGADRLSKTAASVIGVKRIGYAGRLPSEHQKYGVIDPVNANETKEKGRGDRLTIKKKDGVLCDYIIGKKVPGKEDHRYVRRPDETSVYITKIDPDLSTRFTDWINADLLELKAEKLNSILLHRYRVDQQEKVIKIEGQHSITRNSPEEPWELQDLNKEKEELNQQSVNAMIDELSKLKIVGVRPKPEQLIKSLKLSKGISFDQISALDLLSKGFSLLPFEDGRFNLCSSEGELWVGLNDGVNYNLRFGEIVTGDSDTIEIGKTQIENKSKPDENILPDLSKNRYMFIEAEFDPSLIGNPPAKPEKPAILKEAEEKANKDKPASGDKKPATSVKETKPSDLNPVEPKAEDKNNNPAPDTKPAEKMPTEKTPEQKLPTEKKPEDKKTETENKDAGKPQSSNQNITSMKELVPVLLQDEKPAQTKPADKKVEENKTEETKPADKKVEEKNADENKPVETKPAIPPSEKSPEMNNKPAEQQPKVDPETALKMAQDEYNTAMLQYEHELAKHKEKIKAGQTRVNELNKRFAEWYYVISSNSFETLSIGRDKLVLPKEKIPPGFESPNTKGKQQMPTPQLNIPEEPANPVEAPKVNKNQTEESKTDPIMKDPKSKDLPVITPGAKKE